MWKYTLSQNSLCRTSLSINLSTSQTKWERRTAPCIWLLSPCLRKADGQSRPQWPEVQTTLGVTPLAPAERQAPEPTWGMVYEHRGGESLAGMAIGRSRHTRPELKDQPSTLYQPGLQTWPIQALGLCWSIHSSARWMLVKEHLNLHGKVEKNALLGLHLIPEPHLTVSMPKRQRTAGWSFLQGPRPGAPA